MKKHRLQCTITILLDRLYIYDHSKLDDIHFTALLVLFQYFLNHNNFTISILIERLISGDGSIDESLSQKRIPKRKYIVGSVFLEWECIEGGRPEVFEISVHFPNMGSLSLHIVTKTMQGHPNMLKENNFVVDPDYSNKFYYVQKGSGFSEAMTFRDAIDSMVNYLEGKRCAKGENENNGVILLFRGFEELAIIVRALEWAGHNDILLGNILKANIPMMDIEIYNLPIWRQ